MSTVAGIHILTDRKAKIMTLIQASMRDAENAARIKRALDEETDIGVFVVHSVFEQYCVYGVC